MTNDATVGRLIERVAPGTSLDTQVLARLQEKRPDPQELAAILASVRPAEVRAAVAYLGLEGGPRDAAALALCLHHEDADVVRLAEHALWTIWMQSGSPSGNRRLRTAVALLSQDQVHEAAGVLSDLVCSEPDFAEAHFQLGLACAALEQHADAAREYLAALRANPYHFAAAAACGHALLEQGDLDGAVRQYRQSLKIHPRQPEVADALEQVLAARGAPRCNEV